MVKNLVFYAILLYASVRDHKTHTVPDSVHVLILLAAIPGIRLLSSLLGFFLVPLPFLAAALKKPDGHGKGDCCGNHRTDTGCISAGGILEKSECPLCIDTVFNSRMYGGKFN